MKRCQISIACLTQHSKGTLMKEVIEDLFINRNKPWIAYKDSKKAISRFLLLTVLFFLISPLIAAEDEVEEIILIREGPPPLIDPEYLDLGTFVVNMPGDKYFLKSSIQLAFENSAAREWLLVRLPIAKDLIITHLNSISVEQFNDTKSRAVIKNDLQIRLNSLFPNKAVWEDSSPIRRILFLEFYRQ